jgi:hypothetical protein
MLDYLVGNIGASQLGLCKRRDRDATLVLMKGVQRHKVALVVLDNQ